MPYWIAIESKTMTKTYDQHYFNHWYRNSGHGVGRAALIARKAALAVAMAEYYLGRPVRSVLDVGCGEGNWRAPLLKLRPKLDYRGIDSSEYAVAKYGRRRNLALVEFGQLAQVRFGAPVDLLVCSDVLHYVRSAELNRGLSGFSELCSGLAFIDLYCKGDAISGDLRGFQMRTAAWYRKAFAKAGFTACGSHGYLSPPLTQEATSLEIFP
jgi:SAM-dependent methyltransferase